MIDRRTMSRRGAMNALGATPLAGLAAQTAPADQPRDLTPAGDDMGSLYPDKVNYGGRLTATAFLFGGRRLNLDDDLKYGRERSPLGQTAGPQRQ